MNPETDLINFLLQGDQQTSGHYDHVNWSINLQDTSHSLQAKIASIHEALHSDLNNSTGYGLLLIIVAYLARNRLPEQSKTLLQLVDRCRFGHETYATYLSCILMEQAGFDTARETIQTEYPEYAKYIKFAESIIPRQPNSIYRQIALNNVIKLCFQTPLVRSLNGEKVSDGFLSEFSSSEFPDSRLETISSYLSRKFWDETINDYLHKARIPKAWMSFFDPNTQAMPISMEVSVEPDFVRQQNDLNTFINERLRQIFGAHNIQMLNSGEHLEFLEILVPQVNELVSDDCPDGQLKISQHNDETFTLKAYETEILKLADSKLVVELTEFRTTSRSMWEDFLSGSGDDEHYFIVSRIIERMKKDYDFSDQDLAVLSKHKNGFAVFLRNVIWKDGRKVVQICLFDNPNQLRVLDKISKKKMLSNSSMLLLSFNAWQEEWHDKIQAVSSHTVLFDLSPFTQIERSFPAFCEELQVSKIWYSMGDKEYTSLLLLGRGKITSIFFIVCSEITASAIIDYIGSIKNKLMREGMKVNISNDLPKEIHYINRLLLTHLFTEEITFDFDALNSQFAKNGFKNEKFI